MYDEKRPRNRIIIEGLRKSGIDVAECHYPLWGGVEDKSRIRSFWRIAGLCVSLFFGYVVLCVKYLFIGSHDAVIVGYLGHLDMFIARPLAFLRKKPLFFNAFISLYDTVVSDRKLIAQNHPLAGICRFLDRQSCRFAGKVLLDTESHIEYFNDTFKIPKNKCARVFVGAEEEVFSPSGEDKKAFGRDCFSVLFYGQYVPLQGAVFIVYAAKLIEHHAEIRFTFIGRGQEYESVRQKAENFHLRNIEWIEWVPYRSLAAHIQRADICLGIFGDTGKAKRVIPNKAFQVIAMKRPLITGDSPAARELFTDKENALLCPMADPKALSEAILTLKDDALLRQGIAEKGHILFRERCSTKAIGDAVSRILREGMR